MIIKTQKYLPRRASDQQTVAIIANGIAVAIASEEIPSAEDKITLTGNNGELDKYNTTITDLAGAENNRKLQLASKADFQIHANGSVTTTIYWIDGYTDSTVVLIPTEPSEETPLVEANFMLYAIGSNGSVNGSGTYAAGLNVEISAIPDSGYRFVNWTSTAGVIDNVTSSSTTISMPDRNITVTAKFELLAPTITWTSVSSKNKIDVKNSQPGALLTLYKDGNPIKSHTGTSFGAPDKLDIGRYTVTQTVNGEVSLPSNELFKN